MGVSRTFGDESMKSKKFPRGNSSSTDNPIVVNLPPRGLRIQQAATYAGCTAWFIRQSIWDGKLPARTGGKFLIILRDDLDFFLESLPRTERNTAKWLMTRRIKSADTAEPEQVTTR